MMRVRITIFIVVVANFLGAPSGRLAKIAEPVRDLTEVPVKQMLGIKEICGDSWATYIPISMASAVRCSIVGVGFFMNRSFSASSCCGSGRARLRREDMLYGVPLRREALLFEGEGSSGGDE